MLWGCMRGQKYNHMYVICSAAGDRVDMLARSWLHDTQGNSPCYPWDRRLDGLQSQYGCFWEEKNFLPLLWIIPPEHTAQSLISVLTRLSCLLLLIEIQHYVGVKWHYYFLTHIFLHFAIRCQRLLDGMVCWTASWMRMSVLSLTMSWAIRATVGLQQLASHSCCLILSSVSLLLSTCILLSYWRITHRYIHLKFKYFSLFWRNWLYCRCWWDHLLYDCLMYFNV